MRHVRFFALIALGLAASAAAAFVPAPAPWDGPLSCDAGQTAAVPAGPTRILVLGTFHLSQIKDRFDPAYLDSLLERLVAFHPSAIAVESLPGDYISSLEGQSQNSPLVQEVLAGFADKQRKLGHAAQARLQTDSFRAAAEAEKRLAGDPILNRPALVMWLLAAYNMPSAVLQWGFLPPAEKASQTDVPPETAAALDEALRQVNEVPALANRLAARLGLTRLYPVDDFEDLGAFGRIEAVLEKEYAGNPLLKAIAGSPVYSEDKRRLEAALTGRDLLPVYRALNSPAFARADIEAQWGVFLRTRFPGGEDRARLALWENRNLKIAARIQAVCSAYPGRNVLVIYGAAHKPFLENYLGRMMNTEIVRFDDLKSR
jgi:hypothetical protein